MGIGQCVAMETQAMVTSAIAGIMMLVMLCGGCRYLYRSITGKQPLYRVEHCWNERQWKDIKLQHDIQWKARLAQNKDD